MIARSFHQRPGFELPPFAWEPSAADQLAALRAICQAPMDEVYSQGGAVLCYHCPRCGAIEPPERPKGEQLLFGMAGAVAGGAA